MLMDLYSINPTIGHKILPILSYIRFMTYVTSPPTGSWGCRSLLWSWMNYSETQIPQINPPGHKEYPRYRSHLPSISYKHLFSEWKFPPFGFYLCPVPDLKFVSHIPE